jgi:hypothetical protein
VIATRYLWHAAALLLLGLVPTAIHVYGGPPELDPAALERRLPDTLGRFAGAEPGPRRAAWVATSFGPAPFVTRSYPARAGEGRIEFFAATSYDWKKLFHFPENALAHGHLVSNTRRVEADGLPLRVLEFATSESLRVAVYGLLYGDEPVSDPVRHVVLRVPKLFVSRREPMTLVYAQADGVPGQEAELAAELVELVGAAGAELRR